MQAALAKRLLREEATHKGESAEMPRREQGAFRREVIARQAEMQAKVPVQAPQPVTEEKDDDMEEDEEEPEKGEEAEGNRETPIEVTAEVVAPREEPKPVDVKQKSRGEEVTTRTLPKRGDELTAAMGQWAGGPPNDKSMVVVDEGAPRAGRREGRVEEKGEDDERGAPVERSTEEREERAGPVFDDMEEPTVEIAVWTTARE